MSDQTAEKIPSLTATMAFAALFTLASLAVDAAGAIGSDLRGIEATPSLDLAPLAPPAEVK